MKKKLSKEHKKQRIIGATFALNNFRENIIKYHFSTTSLTTESILEVLKYDIDRYKNLSK